MLRVYLLDRYNRTLLAFSYIALCVLWPNVVSAQEEKPAEHSAAGSQQAKRPEKKGATEGPKESAEGIVLTGHLSRDSARPDGKIRFWITIENKSTGPLQNLHFTDFFTPGFNRPLSFNGGCDGGSWGSVCKSLPAQQTVTIWGDLSAAECATIWGFAVECPPRENAFAVLAWDAPQHPGQSGVIDLGEIERLSWYSATWRWLTRLDIGLPTLTAIVLGLFGWWQKGREKRQEKRKQKEEQKDQLEAERRDRYQQTWNLMLSQANRFTLSYYVPTGNAIITAAYYIGICQKKLKQDSSAQGTAKVEPSEDDYLTAFFYLIQVQWLRLYMKRDIGGYYFKDRTAELVTEGLFQKHRACFDVRSPERQLILMKFCKLLRRNSQPDRFIADKGAWSDEQKRFFGDYFKIWLKDADGTCSHDLIVLSAMSKVLSYESNRPFLNWYQEQPPEKLTDKEEAEIIEIGEAGNALNEEGKPAGPELPARVRAYLDEIKKGVPRKMQQERTALKKGWSFFGTRKGTT